LAGKSYKNAITDAAGAFRQGPLDPAYARIEVEDARRLDAAKVRRDGPSPCVGRDACRGPAPRDRGGSLHRRGSPFSLLGISSRNGRGVELLIVNIGCRVVVRSCPIPTPVRNQRHREVLLTFISMVPKPTLGSGSIWAEP